MIEINKITQGDCLEILKKIPDESVQVCFADPPFNLKKKYNSYSDDLDFQEYLNWCELWMLELIRITKPNGSIFIHNIPKWLTFYASFLNKHAIFRHWISWDAPTSPMGKSLQPGHYGILYYVKHYKERKFYEIRHPHKRARGSNILQKDYGGKKFMLHPFGPLVSDVWTDLHRVKINKYRDDHPCQLPIPLLERIILMSSDEGDIILDPFSGTGTTAIAAKRLGRKYIGIELDQEYVKISENKLKIEQSTSKLGDFWVSFHLNRVVTLRNQDWKNLSDYFILPQEKEEVDQKEIKLKNNINPNPDLFSPKIEIKPMQNSKKIFLNEKQEFELQLQALIPENFRMKK